MTKIILWVFLIIVALFALRLLNMAKAKRRTAEPRREPSPPDTMVRCALCGVYLPRADAASGPNGLTCGDAGCAQKR